MRTTSGLITLAEEGPPSPSRRVVARLLTLALVAVVLLGGYTAYRYLAGELTDASCQVTVNGQTHSWALDQASNAAVITAIAMKRGMPARAASIALATAMQESKVRNITYGDRDSVGLFQQRPSQGWGTVEQIMNPEYSTNKFYDELEKVTGYESMVITEAAQAVQRSAYPDAYAQHETQARATASALSGETPAALACVVPEPDGEVDPQRVVDLLKADYGMTASIKDGVVTVAAPSAQRAWSVAQWAVARAVDTGAGSVQVGAHIWTRAPGKSGYAWAQAVDVGERTVIISMVQP